jgi:hypothetical protein
MLYSAVRDPWQRGNVPVNPARFGAVEQAGEAGCPQRCVFPLATLARIADRLFYFTETRFSSHALYVWIHVHTRDYPRVLIGTHPCQRWSNPRITLYASFSQLLARSALTGPQSLATKFRSRSSVDQSTSIAQVGQLTQSEVPEPSMLSKHQKL